MTCIYFVLQNYDIGGLKLVTILASYGCFSCREHAVNVLLIVNGGGKMNVFKPTFLL